MVWVGRPAKPPSWVTFPGDEWVTITPREAGLDADKFESWVHSQQPQFGKSMFGQEPEGGGVVLSRGGYLIQEWGDPTFAHQSASLGKTFTRMVLQLAIDEGLIKSRHDVITQYWNKPGLAPHKALHGGHHRTLTFNHLAEMTGGFPVTNGYYWRKKAGIEPFYSGTPEWASWTGDPDYDNYAHVEPGSRIYYSSGGYWRLAQVLTAIWGKDLKEVLDERIMSEIGIPPERWEWLTGKQVRDNIAFYPDRPGYGDYIDAPYEIDNIPIRGGPGWVVMSARDLARVGLLIATGGQWKNKSLVSLLSGNSGMGTNRVDGWGILNPKKWFVTGKQGYFSLGKVAADFRDPEPDIMAEWIIGPVETPQ